MGILRALHLIEGREVPSVSGKMFLSVNPATAEPIAEVAEGDAEDIDRAVQAASRAFIEGAWGRLAPWERGRVLRKVADLIRDRAEHLARLDTLDAGKPITNTRTVDVPGSAGLFDFYAGAPDKFTGTVYASDQGYHNFTVREPYGVVGAIAPWNFPLYNAALKVAPALAAGNTVVVKMAEQSPLSTLELGRICLDAGIPPGVVNVVHGFGPTAGAALVRHPIVQKISFTGSTAVGKEILRSAADGVKSVSLELGGKTANIIFADADLDQALAGTMFTSFYTSGQICTTGSRLLVHERVADRFLDGVTARAQALRLGDPLDEQTQLGPLVSDEQLARVTGYVQSGRAEGARVMIGGDRPALAGRLAAGYFLKPTIFVDVVPQMRIAREEIFGPVLSVIRFKDTDEAVRIANSVAYGLAATIWTTDVRKLFALAKALDAGIIWANTVHYLTAGVPYSGHKESGLDEDMGMEALRAYTKLKTVYLHHGSSRIQWG